MSIEHLVQMANDIGEFFRVEPEREEAVKGMLNHLQKFWTTRMRQQAVEHLREGGEGLDELPREVIGRLG